MANIVAVPSPFASTCPDLGSAARSRLNRVTGWRPSSPSDSVDDSVSSGSDGWTSSRTSPQGTLAEAPQVQASSASMPHLSRSISDTQHLTQTASAGLPVTTVHDHAEAAVPMETSPSLLRKFLSRETLSKLTRPLGFKFGKDKKVSALWQGPRPDVEGVQWCDTAESMRRHSLCSVHEFELIPEEVELRTPYKEACCTVM